MSTITIEISPLLEKKLQQLVLVGWFKNADTLVEEALHRYLASHPMDDLMTQFIIDDIEWGLYGENKPDRFLKPVRFGCANVCRY